MCGEGGGGVLIAYIVQSFQKLFVSLDPIPSPYKESPAQMNSGSAGNSLYRFILAKSRYYKERQVDRTKRKAIRR